MWQGMRKRIFLGLGLLFVVSWGTSRAQEAPKARQEISKVQDAGFPNTPEGAVQNFIVAMATGNEPALRALSLPLPKEEFAWLLVGEHLPADKYQEFRKAVATQMNFRVGRPGDKFPLGNGRVLELRAMEFGLDRSVVVHDAAPLPTRVRRVEGRWRVDAAPMVVGRKAAMAARKRAEEKAKAKAPAGKP